MKKTEKNRGAAMVIVLCVMVVFLALSTTIVLAGSVALNTARNNAGRELGKAQAVSLSEVFARELQNDKSIRHSDSYLKKYVRDKILGGWPSYDEEESTDKQTAGVVKHFTLDTTGTDGDETHQIEIEMYWTYEDETDGMVAGKTVTEADEEALSLGSLHLFIDVISILNDAEYHVKRDFHLEGPTKFSPPDPASPSPYPYEWTWEVMGRNPERDKAGKAGGG